MGHDDFGKRMNSIPKYVVSSTLSDEAAQWGPTTVLRGALEEDVARLRDEFDGSLLVEGSAALVHGLAAADLVDAYRLMVFPVVLGPGLRVFPNTPADAQRFDLVEALPAGAGIVLLRYERAR